MDVEKTKNVYFKNERYIRKKLLPTIKDQKWLENFLEKKLHVKPNKENNEIFF